jgi:hypothetical protein
MASRRISNITSRILYPVIAILSILVLAWVLFMQPSKQPPAPPQKSEDPRTVLEGYLEERMNYGLDFSVKLAEKRIAYARQVAQERPELEYVAQRVIDSLHSRINRKAVIGG